MCLQVISHCSVWGGVNLAVKVQYRTQSQWGCHSAESLLNTNFKPAFGVIWGHPKQTVSTALNIQKYRCNTCSHFSHKLNKLKMAFFLCTKSNYFFQILSAYLLKSNKISHPPDMSGKSRCWLNRTQTQVLGRELPMLVHGMLVTSFISNCICKIMLVGQYN